MDTRNSMRILAVATLVAVSAAAVAQTQGQSQQSQSQQNQSQQAQTQQGQQQPQPQKKKSFWQKVRDAAQQGQNTVQNGQSTVQNTVQNGQSTVQNTVQQGSGAVQNTTQQVQNGAQQEVQGASPGNQANGAVSGGGAGSCGQSCFDAGPFQANVSQMTMSQLGGWHVIRMNIQFHNSTNQPLIIAYHEGSMVMVDNNGSTYIPAGGNPGELQGMGIDRGEQTDSSFVLNPGQTGNALFSVARGRAANSPIGTSYAYNLTIDELQAQNGALAIPVRQYTLNFPNLAPGANNTAAFPSGTPANGFAAGGTGTNSVAGAATAPAKTQAAGVAARRGTAVTPAQRMVNGRPAVVTHPTTPVNNVAMKTPAAMTARPSTAVRSTAVRPIPVKTNPKATTPPKKKTASTTTTPPTK